MLLRHGKEPATRDREASVPTIQERYFSESLPKNDTTLDAKTRPLFVVGGYSEAAHVSEAGYEAINSAESDLADIALRSSREGRVVVPFLMNTDSRKELEDACRAAGAAFYGCNRDGRVPQPVSSDDDTLQQVLSELEAEAVALNEELVNRANVNYLKTLGVHDVAEVALQIASGQADRERVSTGLETLDKALGGGLPMGTLVTLGATSSTGKTTLALQLSDTIAASGRPVLFVTVEQGRHELVAKSISRLMRLTPKRYGWYSVSSADIQSAETRDGWDEDTRDTFHAAGGRYSSSIAPNTYVMETDRQPSTADIRKAAEAIRRQRGKAPVVFVDYLQLLSPASDKMTDKQAVDRNVMDLRHIARDLVTCVFAISSLNRSSYSTGVTLEAFKESGAVEYGSDILLGMQPRDLMQRLEGVSENKQKAEARKVEKAFKSSATREVVVTVLKNRGGAVNPGGVPLDYSAISNLFTCATAGEGRTSGRRQRL